MEDPVVAAESERGLFPQGAVLRERVEFGCAVAVGSEPESAVVAEKAVYLGLAWLQQALPVVHPVNPEAVFRYAAGVDILSIKSCLLLFLTAI